MLYGGNKSLQSKKDIEKERNKWVLRVIITFAVVVGFLIATEELIKMYGLSDTYMKIMFPVFGVIYLFQIFSYRKIKCSNCGHSIFNQFSILFPVPTECKRCKIKIKQ